MMQFFRNLRIYEDKVEALEEEIVKMKKSNLEFYTACANTNERLIKQVGSIMDGVAERFKKIETKKCKCKHES